jgi:DNA-binding MarR family transcriptional regulator
MGENKNLPESELDIMLVIWELGCEVTAPAILNGLERPLTASALHSYLKRLEEKGFILCQPGRSDRRQKIITSTSQARAMQADVAPNDTQTFQELCRGLPPEQIRAFLDITDVMLGNVLGECEKTTVQQWFFFG